MKGDGKISEYVGSYSDLLKEQKQTATLKKTSKPTGKATSRTQTVAPSQGNTGVKPANSRAPVKRKLSFKQVHQLKTLPGEIEALEKEIRQMEIRLNDTDFYQKDPTAFHETVSELTKKRAALEEMENTWLELEILQEEINAK